MHKNKFKSFPDSTISVKIFQKIEPKMIKMILKNIEIPRLLYNSDTIIQSYNHTKDIDKIYIKI